MTTTNGTTDTLLTDEDRRRMIRASIRDFESQIFAQELLLVANKTVDDYDVSPHEERIAALRRGIANLREEYATLLAVSQPVGADGA